MISSEQPPFPNEIFQSLNSFPIDVLKIYPRSFCSKNGLVYGLIRTQEGKRFVVMGNKCNVMKDLFHGEFFHQTSSLKLCDLSPENTECLMALFPYTKPISLREYPITIGMGDCLGLAAPAHVRAVKTFQAHPILIQQSVRENAGAGRNFFERKQDAAWAVFQENYEEGYGAGGDYLKSLQEVKHALDAGVSMITLDLSEKIDPEILQQPKEWVDRKFKEEIDEGDAKVILHLFLDKEFAFRGTEGEFSIRFDEESVKRNALLFYKALDFTEEVYEWIRLQRKNQGAIDLEISLGETPFLTSPESHFFFALELSHRGVHIQYLAPRFVGGLQRGIDSKGDREMFRDEFYRHALIAEDYGYKISIDSGSNQFSFLSDIGELSKGFLHFKMTHTSCLEAMRLVAQVHPLLYRQLHSLAPSEWVDASKPRHATIDLNRITKLEELSDEDLPALLDQEDCRQLLHITCGTLLDATNQSGESLFREKLYHTLTQHEENYWSMLEADVEKHLTAIRVPKKENATERELELNLPPPLIAKEGRE